MWRNVKIGSVGRCCDQEKKSRTSLVVVVLVARAVPYRIFVFDCLLIP